MSSNKPMYLSAGDIEAMPGQHKVHFLNDSAVRVNKSLGDATGLTKIGVHLITVAPGHASTEFHAHHVEEECMYVVSGQARATIGDERRRLGPGDFIGCPANGIAHEMVNDGDEPFVCLVMGQRLPYDVADYPRLGKRLYRHDGQWDLVDHDRIQHIDRKA